MNVDTCICSKFMINIYDIGGNLTPTKYFLSRKDEWKVFIKKGDIITH